MRHEKIRFDDAEILTEDRLRQLAPSVFATTAHDSRSERFRPIPTIEVVRGLANEGFHVVSATQCKAKTPDRANFTKHLLRLRRSDAYQVGGTVFEVLLKNGNDGSSAWDLMAGLWRILCLNGMVAAMGAEESLKVRHTGDAMGKVIEGSYEILKQSEIALKAPPLWGEIKLDHDERVAFAESAHMIRFGDSEGLISTSIQPAQLLDARRSQDQHMDLWTTFNVVQENAIKGGLHGEGFDAQNRRRRTTTRAIKGIDQDLKINRALWQLADKMAVLKGSKSLISA